MEKREILKHLRDFIEAKKGTDVDKGLLRTLEALENVKEEDILIGEEPKLFNAYMECNSTGVGESRFEGTKTQRTVALDYVTDEYLFADGHMGAAQKALSLFVLKPEETTTFRSKEDIAKAAKEYGFILHSQKFRDLNFLMVSHRLNRYTTKITKGPKSYPVRPIFAKLDDKKDPFTIGYVYVKDGAEYIIIEPEEASGFGKLANSFGCAPWMFLGLIFPPILVVAAAVIIYKYIKANK